MLHKLAYGTDTDESLAHHGADTKADESEIAKLRARIAELETQNTPAGGKA